MIKAAILTVSDSCSKGQRDDKSGPGIREMLGRDKFEVCRYEIVPDDKQAIIAQLRRFADEDKVDIVLTTGGTGLSGRDVTPEATLAVCDRLVPGLSELIRSEGLKSTKNAILSRGVAGLCGDTLIVNLPGSPKGAGESLAIILDILPHAKDMMLGKGH